MNVYYEYAGMKVTQQELTTVLVLAFFFLLVGVAVWAGSNWRKRQGCSCYRCKK